MLSSFADQQVRPIAEAIDQYSQLGLRTLCFAWRDLDEEEYAAWAGKYKEASTSLTDREVGLLLTTIVWAAGEKVGRIMFDITFGNTVCLTTFQQIDKVDSIQEAFLLRRIA